MTRYVEVQYPDGWPTQVMFADGLDMAEAHERGYTITPLVAMTPERVEALLEIIDTARMLSGEVYYYEKYTKPALDILKAMLAEAEGGSDGR